MMLSYSDTKLGRKVERKMYIGGLITGVIKSERFDKWYYKTFIKNTMNKYINEELCKESNKGDVN